MVSPHGAGLSNLVYSEPGTFVIKCVCHLHELNLWFLNFMHELGHHYHAVAFTALCALLIIFMHYYTIKYMHNYNISS